MGVHDNFFFVGIFQGFAALHGRSRRGSCDGRTALQARKVSSENYHMVKKDASDDSMKSYDSSKRSPRYRPHYDQSRHA